MSDAADRPNAQIGQLDSDEDERLALAAADRPNAQIGQADTDEDERLALAAAEAIRRLIAERNALRVHAAAQARELLRLQRHITLIRDSYRRLTYEFVTQLQQIDNTVSDLFPQSMATRRPAPAPNEKRDRPED